MKERVCNNKNQKKIQEFYCLLFPVIVERQLQPVVLMSAFKQTGKRVSACKCGTDYIDPMFHREVLGVDSKNRICSSRKKKF